MMNELDQLIKAASFLNDEDKEFLREQLPVLKPIEKLQLRFTIQSGKVPEVLEALHALKKKIAAEEEKPKQHNMFTKAVQTVFKPKPPRIVSHSFLNQPDMLGGHAPKPPQYTQTTPLSSLQDIVSLSQLKQLSSLHVTFLPHQNPEVEIQNFIDKVDSLLQKYPSIADRRDRFMYLLPSPLFVDYINTGLTAERHPELKPATIILNTLHQIDPAKYLNGKQFRYASIIIAQCRLLCGL